tara:strand:+ start:2317 stop:2496 length:180 start_codon:yes stop_codon:yes gene_type:complete
MDDYESEQQRLQEEYEEECMENYPLTWEIDEYEIDHSYSRCYDCVKKAISKSKSGYETY